MSRFHEELYRQKGPKHDALVIKCVSSDGLKRILEACNLKDELKDLVYDYETEVICESCSYRSRFILGYADIVITGYTNEEKSKYDGQMYILVEAKPSLLDVGSTVRQLKTYESVLPRATNRWQIKKVIATYTEISNDVKAFLEHENVVVVVFKEVP